MYQVAQLCMKSVAETCTVTVVSVMETSREEASWTSFPSPNELGLQALNKQSKTQKKTSTKTPKQPKNLADQDRKYLC